MMMWHVPLRSTYSVYCRRRVSSYIQKRSGSRSSRILHVEEIVHTESLRFSVNFWGFLPCILYLILVMIYKKQCSSVEYYRDQTHELVGCWCTTVDWKVQAGGLHDGDNCANELGREGPAGLHATDPKGMRLHHRATFLIGAAAIQSSQSPSSRTHTAN